MKTYLTPLRIPLAISALALAASLAGCSTYAYGPDGSAIAVAPPPVRLEAYGPAPYPDAIWIGGYWGWDNGRHQWHGGHWDHNREGYRWRAHRWEQDRGSWRMRQGGWERR